MKVNTTSDSVPTRGALAYDLGHHGAVLVTKELNSVGQFNYTTRPLSPRFVQFILFCERFFR
jgi:hypothetical protein